MFLCGWRNCEGIEKMNREQMNIEHRTSKFDVRRSSIKPNNINATYEQVQNNLVQAGGLFFRKFCHCSAGTIRAVAGGDVQFCRVMDKFFNRNPIACAGFFPAVISNFFANTAHG